jgi:hypothetical protein
LSRSQQVIVSNEYFISIPENALRILVVFLTLFAAPTRGDAVPKAGRWANAEASAKKRSIRP